MFLYSDKHDVGQIEISASGITAVPQGQQEGCGTSPELVAPMQGPAELDDELGAKPDGGWTEPIAKHWLYPEPVLQLGTSGFFSWPR